MLFTLDSEDQLYEECSNEAVHRITPTGMEYWTPICDETLKPRLGQMFPTIDDAYDFYKEYGRKSGFDIRKNTSRKDKSGYVLHKYYVCSNAGSYERSCPSVDNLNSDGKQTRRRRTSSTRCNCPAKLVLKFHPNQGYVVMGFSEEHNHPLVSTSCRKFLRSNREVGDSHKIFICDMKRAKIGPMKSYTVLKEMVGSYDNVRATSTDFKNFGRDVKARIGEHDADMILEKFRMKAENSQNAFSYDYKVDTDGHLTGIFWADSICRRNYSIFGDILSFDPTFRTNK